MLQNTIHIDTGSLLTAGGGELVEWVNVLYFPNGVRAGVPIDAGDDTSETIAIPKTFADNISFVVPVRGQSMRDFDLREGDKLLVRYTECADNGDFVIVSIDGGNTVKVYYEDENGDRWLVPGNPDFRPILLSPTKYKKYPSTPYSIHSNRYLTYCNHYASVFLDGIDTSFCFYSTS